MIVFACRACAVHRTMREMDPELASDSSDHGAAIIDRHSIHIIFVHAQMTTRTLF